MTNSSQFHKTAATASIYKTQQMSPKAKEHGLGELTVKLEFEREPKDRVNMKNFKSIISAACIFGFGQIVPSYEIGYFLEQSQKGTVITNAQQLNLL